jgi:hypothetical protein
MSCSLVARAKALGVSWKGELKDVNFTDCPVFSPISEATGAVASKEAPHQLLPRWADIRTGLATGQAALAAAPDVILQGIRPGLPQLGLVFVQGAEVSATAYIPFLKAVQEVRPPRVFPCMLCTSRPHRP